MTGLSSTFVLCLRISRQRAKFQEEDWRLVDQLYDNLKDASMPSLIEQLHEHPIRKTLDKGILTFLGVDEPKADKIGEVLRKGVLEGIEALKRTMTK